MQMMSYIQDLQGGHIPQELSQLQQQMLECPLLFLFPVISRPIHVSIQRNILASLRPHKNWQWPMVAIKLEMSDSMEQNGCKRWNMLTACNSLVACV